MRTFRPAERRARPAPQRLLDDVYLVLPAPLRLRLHADVRASLLLGRDARHAQRKRTAGAGPQAAGPRPGPPGLSQHTIQLRSSIYPKISGPISARRTTQDTLKYIRHQLSKTPFEHITLLEHSEMPVKYRGRARVKTKALDPNPLGFELWI